MLRRGAPSGYTIVETMIFLVITTALFASAMLAVGGKQATVQFTQGIRDAQSKIQDIINDVATGYYPSNGDFACAYTQSNALSRPVFTAGAVAQGSSNACVFLGKAVQFTASGATAGEGATNYNVFSIAARRLNVSGQDVQSLNDALPTALAPTIAGDMAGISNKIDNLSFQYGIKVTRITTPDLTTARYGTIVLLSGLPKFAGSSSNLTSGKQKVNFAGLSPASPLVDTVYDGANLINTLSDTVALNTQSGIVICLSDQGGSRRAMITVGEGAGQANAKLEIGSYNKVLCEN